MNLGQARIKEGTFKYIEGEIRSINNICYIAKEVQAVLIGENNYDVVVILTPIINGQNSISPMLVETFLSYELC
jgi:hypothetical protein